MEQQTFQRAMTYLAAAYSVELSKERAAVYHDQLGTLRDGPFWSAVRIAVSNEKWFPSVACLLELYKDELRRETRLQTLPQPPLDKTRGKENIARLRRALHQGVER